MTHPKHAKTTHALIPAITKRWSARSFSAEIIEQEDLEAVFEAASWAASSMNEQPWKYLYAHRGSTAFEQMVDCLLPGNEPWAKKGSVMLVALAKKTFDRNGKSNRHAMHDVGAANAYLMLEAAERTIYGHQMGGFDMQKTKDTFQINDSEYEIACFIVLGYLDDADRLEEPYRGREKSTRTRKDIKDFTQNLTT